MNEREKYSKNKQTKRSRERMLREKRRRRRRRKLLRFVVMLLSAHYAGKSFWRANDHACNES